MENISNIIIKEGVLYIYSTYIYIMKAFSYINNNDRKSNGRKYPISDDLRN